MSNHVTSASIRHKQFLGLTSSSYPGHTKIIDIQNIEKEQLKHYRE